MRKEKCYHIKRSYNYSPWEDTIELYGKKLFIEVNENWENCPTVDVNIGDGFVTDPPQSDKYNKVTRIIPELFESYYNDTIKYLSQNFLEKAEYFLEASAHVFKISFYSDKQCLLIDITKEITSFCCRMSLSNGIRGRNTARKKYEILSQEVVKQAFQLTLEFLYNRHSLSGLKDEYFNQISLLLKQQKPIKGLILNADLAFGEARSELLQRIEEVENRLINYDDNPDKRLELRGELKGLKYALKILDSNR